MVVGDLPPVTVVLPVRNEACHISPCLSALLNQDYPRDQVEILVVDGMSDDGTREIVSEFAARDPRIKLLDNPARIVPTALNSGIRQAHGEIVIRVDGHCTIATDYVCRCVQALRATGADNVGGPMRAIGEGYLATAIALATSSRFGVGGATFHYANLPGWVDTVYLGAYRRDVFERIGLFDEELVRNQDDEFNFRLTLTGGRIWLDPQIRSTYFARASVRGLWKQYFEYGFWKVRVIQKHKRPASWRHLVPVVFVSTLIIAFAAGLYFRSPLPFLAVALPYLMVSGVASLRIALERGLRFAPSLPLAFAAMHLAYGVGFLKGLGYFGMVKHIHLKPYAEGDFKPNSG